jgi:predicted component of type VI protein secretion system
VRTQGFNREHGQASVELLGTVPAVLLVAALVWQLALAGQAAWLCANAARAAARAEAVGRDGKVAARRSLPASLARGMHVDKPGAGGAIRVRLHVPLLLQAWQGPVTVAATAHLARAGGSG